MRLLTLRLQDYRNIRFAEISPGGANVFLLGANAQGKTNLLEAAAYLTTLRSFRQADAAHLVAHGASGARLWCRCRLGGAEETVIEVALRRGSREVWCDGVRARRAAEVIGRVPTVVFTTGDAALVRGAPGARRRWLDQVLGVTDPAYLAALQDYHRALEERNRLLKQHAAAAECRAFEAVMAPAAAGIARRRAAAAPRIAELLREAHAVFAPPDEQAGWALLPDSGFDDEAGFHVLLAGHAERDAILGSTQHGPHRDDWEFLINGRPARHEASEGQERSLVLALRFAQAAWVRECTGLDPVLLADDVLGELDPGRRAAMWRAFAGCGQIIATGTELPPEVAGPEWTVIDVKAGSFLPRAGR